MSAPLVVPDAIAARGDARELSPRDLAIGLRVLADLLDAGLPLSRALAAFEEIAPDGWLAGVITARASIREGRRLSTALEECGLSLPSLTIGILRAGEAGSGLAAAMRRAAEHAEASAATRDAIRAALAYPIVVAVAGLGALSVLLGVVLPRFAIVLNDIGQQLPASTRLALDATAFARLAFWPLLLVAGASAAAVDRARMSPEGRRTLHRWLLAMPGVGRIREAAATARFTAALGALLESGVSLRSGLLHAVSAIDDGEIESRALAARTRISAGERVAPTLGELGVLTPTAARLVAAGEETGRLAEMLAYASRIEQARADRLIRAGVGLIEPTLILTLAAIIGVVAAAMLQAVYAVRPG